MIPKNQRTMTLCVALLGCNLLFIWGNFLLQRYGASLPSPT